MKRIMFFVMLVASLVVMTCCSAEDPFSEWNDYQDNQWANNGAQMPGNTGGGSSSTTGELATFTVSLDQTSAEPTTTASEYFPEEEDALENNEF